MDVDTTAPTTMEPLRIEILTTEDFDRDFHRLAKRHRSLPQDLRKFITDLMENRIRGAELSPQIFKYRMGIKTKGRGKSGGARIITYEVILEQSDKTIYLLSIYDKSDRSSISDNEIKDLRKRAGLELVP